MVTFLYGYFRHHLQNHFQKEISSLNCSGIELWMIIGDLKELSSSQNKMRIIIILLGKIILRNSACKQSCRCWFYLNAIFLVEQYKLVRCSLREIGQSSDKSTIAKSFQRSTSREFADCRQDHGPILLRGGQLAQDR